MRTLYLTFNYIKLELFHLEIMRKTIQNSSHINPSTMSTLTRVKSGVGGGLLNLNHVQTCKHIKLIENASDFISMKNFPYSTSIMFQVNMIDLNEKLKSVTGNKNKGGLLIRTDY